MKKDTANKLFFSSLYHNLSNDENTIEDNIQKDKDICLITNEVIESGDHPIVLRCGHKFKYEAILNSVNHSKYFTKKNKVLLKNNQLQCPYCRNIQDELLPHYKSYKRIRYVNSPDKYVMKQNKCKYVFSSGKNKGSVCNSYCIDEYCTKCKLYIDKKEEKKKNITCKEILKSGKNKGNPCGRSCKNNNIVCGIHLKKIKSSSE